MASSSSAGGGPLASAQALYGAGFTGPALVLWTAISGVESAFGTNTTPDNDSNGTTDYGLLQINSSHYGSLGQQGQTQQQWTTALQNPTYNAEQGYSLSGGGTNYGPWGPDISSGAYLSYLPQSFAAAKQVSGQTVTVPQLISFITGQAKASASTGYFNGSPALPSTSTSTTYSGSLGSDYTVSGAAAAATTGNSSGCDGTNGISLLGSTHIFTSCQIKGALGGLEILGGGILCLVGIVLLVATSKKGRQATSAVRQAKSLTPGL